MKKLTIVFILVLLIISGCSGGDFKASETVGEGEIVKLEKGDSISKNSENTRVIIRHTLGTGEKELEVLSGSISLVKGFHSEN